MTLDEGTADTSVLMTDRLIIRPVTLADAEAIFKFKSDKEVTDQYGQVPHRGIDETRAWIARSISDGEEGRSFAWSICMRDEDEVIGECCLWNFDGDRLCAEIGYELRRDRWRNGFMKEALTALISYGFSVLGLHRIEANPLGCNNASRRLLLDLGFVHEGTLRERVRFGGRFVDQMYYGLLQNEWMPCNDRP